MISFEICNSTFIEVMKNILSEKRFLCQILTANNTEPALLLSGYKSGRFNYARLL